MDSHIYSENELDNFLENIQKSIEQTKIEASIPIMLDANGHSIAIIYSPNKKTWLFIDSNQLPPYECKNKEELREKIFRGFMLNPNAYNFVDKIILNSICFTNFNSSQLNELNKPPKLTLDKLKCCNQGRDIITYAIKYENIDTLKEIINFSKKISDFSILNYSLRRNIENLSSNSAIVEFLLSEGLDVNIANTQGKTLLMSASKNNNMKLINLLLEKNVDIFAKDKDGLSALAYAVNSGAERVVNFLLSKGLSANEENKNGKSLLTDAIFSHNITITEALIKGGADLNKKNSRDETPMHLAAKFGNVESIKLLLENGANINVSNKKGETPFIVASNFFNEEVANYLKSVQNIPLFQKKHEEHQMKESNGFKNKLNEINEQDPNRVTIEDETNEYYFEKGSRK